MGCLESALQDLKRRVTVGELRESHGNCRTECHTSPSHSWFGPQSAVAAVLYIATASEQVCCRVMHLSETDKATRSLEGQRRLNSGCVAIEMRTMKTRAEDEGGAMRRQSGLGTSLDTMRERI